MMLLSAAPEVSNYGESVCSLNFASRVASIKLGAIKRSVESGELIKALAEVKNYEKEAEKLKAKVSSLESTIHSLNGKIKELNENNARHSSEDRISSVAASSAVHKIREELDTMKAKEAITAGKLEKALKQIEVLKTTCSASKESDTLAQSTVRSQQKEIHALKEEALSLDEKLKTANSNISKLERKLDSEIQGKRKLANDMMAHDQMANQLRLSNVSLNNEIDSFRKEMELERKNAERLRRSLSKVNGVISISLFCPH